MHMQNGIAASAPAGFEFKKERVDPQLRAAELAAIVEGANSAIKGSARREVGAISFATARNDDDGHYFGQLRSEPLESFGGFEFRFHLPASDTGRHDTAGIVRDVVAAVAKFRAAREAIASYAESVRGLVCPLLDAADAIQVSPPRLVGMGIAFHAMGTADFDLVVDIEMLGDDLQRGIDRVHDGDDERVRKKLAALLAKHRLREIRLASATANRAIGWIDALALRVIDRSGLNRTETISHLLSRPALEFYWESVGDDGEEVGHTGALYWQDGVIRGNVEVLGSDSQFHRETLTTRRPALPETIITALPGRRFGEKFEHPFIPADAVITGAESAGQWLYLGLAMPELLLDDGLRDATPVGRVRAAA